MNKRETINEVLEQRGNVTELQADQLMLSDLDPALKEKIRVRYVELAKKHPGWKRHRLLRYAAEYYHVKITFEK